MVVLNQDQVVGDIVKSITKGLFNTVPGVAGKGLYLPGKGLRLPSGQDGNGMFLPGAGLFLPGSSISEEAVMKGVEALMIPESMRGDGLLDTIGSFLGKAAKGLTSFISSLAGPAKDAGKTFLSSAIPAVAEIAVSQLNPDVPSETPRSRNLSEEAGELIKEVRRLDSRTPKSDDLLEEVKRQIAQERKTPKKAPVKKAKKAPAKKTTPKTTKKRGKGIDTAELMADIIRMNAPVPTGNGITRY